MTTLPLLHVARHGETAWSLSGQHTGQRTDIPLTEAGEEQARRLGARLVGQTFARVWTSPCTRAVQTCTLSGFGCVATTDPDLVEWDYGSYEGRRSVDIHAERPSWDLFRDGCPGGESAADVGSRADRVVRRVREVGGNVLLFSSGHFLRVLAARWLGSPAAGGRHFVLGTTGLGALGYEHTLAEAAVHLWNDTSHLGKSSGE